MKKISLVILSFAFVVGSCEGYKRRTHRGGTSTQVPKQEGGIIRYDPEVMPPPPPLVIKHEAPGKPLPAIPKAPALKKILASYEDIFNPELMAILDAANNFNKLAISFELDDYLKKFKKDKKGIVLAATSFGEGYDELGTALDQDVETFKKKFNSLRLDEKLATIKRISEKTTQMVIGLEDDLEINEKQVKEFDKHLTDILDKVDALEGDLGKFAVEVTKALK